MTARRAIGLACAAGLLAAGLPVAARAQVTPGSRVLVMPFSAEVDAGAPGGAGAALWLGEAAATLVTEGLSSRGVGALSRDDRVAAFDQLNLPMSSALTRATMIRVGDLINASEIVLGDVHLGDTLQVRARLVRLGAGREMPWVSDEGPLDQIFQVFARVAARLASQTGRFRPTSPAPPPLPLGAFESYMKGLVAATPATQQRFLEEAIRQAPTDPRVLMALWNTYTVEGMHEKALAAANAVPVDTAASRKARFAVALSLVALKRFDGAFQALSALYEAAHAAAISNALGVVQLRRGTPGGGQPPAVYFRRAVDEDPENTDYLFNLGYANALAHRPGEALTWLREAVRFDAADGDAHLVMSVVLARAARMPEAAREYDLARLLGMSTQAPEPAADDAVPEGLERLASTPEALSSLQVHTLIGNPGQRDQQQTAAFHLANGRALIKDRKDRAAADELRRAAYLTPYDQAPHLLLGELYERAGRISEATDEFKVAIWCRDTAPARVALGRVLLETGDVDGAREQANRALALAPDSTAARDLLKQIGG